MTTQLSDQAPLHQIGQSKVIVNPKIEREEPITKENKVTKPIIENPNNPS